MGIPDKIKISRLEDYHTHYVGHYVDGRQFWGYETFVFDESYDASKRSEWMHHRQDYLALHIFDERGNYLSTRHQFIGTPAKSYVDPEGIIERWIEEQGEIEFGDIEITLFQTVIDGYIFGLVADEQDECVNLQPNAMISFQEPWDGEYYT